MRFVGVLIGAGILAGAAGGAAWAGRQHTPGQEPPRSQRSAVPQPVQGQALEYFVGSWRFKWIGRESVLTPGGSREGTVTFSVLETGRFLERRAETRNEAALGRETATLGFDPDRKSVALSERLPNGIELFSQGDWASPLAIHLKSAPVRVKGQVLVVRRTLSVIGPASFSQTEELSVDGGPWGRLGNAFYSRLEADHARGSAASRP